MELSARMLQGKAVARSAAAQSMVLLKNVNNALPLLAPEGQSLPIAVFGVGQIRTVIGGTGSGQVNVWKSVCLLDGLNACPTLAPDGLLARKYRTWCLAHPDETKGNFFGPLVHHNRELPVSDLDLPGLAERCQAAVVVLSRIAGEGGDMQPADLLLEEEETELVRAVCQAFERSVLVLNTPGYLDVADVLPGFAAALFIGLPGQEAGGALCDVLTGAVPPSGHLSDTWPLRYADYPCAETFGSGPENGVEHTGMMGRQRQIDLAYNEDIFVGYRFFDTFGKPVLFPFGYGLTYGAPVLAQCAAGYAAGAVTLTAQVENTSETYPCRAVVQVYASKPRDGREQPVYQLAAFQKTETLQPGQSQTLTVTFPLEELASYDEKTACYVLDAGYYDLRVGFSSRGTQVAGSLYLPKPAVTRQLSNRLGTLPANALRLSAKNAAPASYPDEAQELEAARRLAIRIPDRWQKTRAVSYAKSFRGCLGVRDDVTLYDVKNGEATLYELVAQMTDAELCRLCCGTGMDLSGIEGMNPEGAEGPLLTAPGGQVSAQFDVPGAAGQTADFWEAYKIPHVSLADGPSGLRLRREIKNDDGEVVRRQICTAFPTGSLLACAWDPAVLRGVGEAVGAEMNEYRVDLWLAPGMNLHRSPLCGRNYEYYSEDPLLTGLCAAAITKGVQSAGGGGVTLKHFAGNNQEHLRECSNDLASERALRELYLRGFEIAVKTGRPRAIMTSYNDIHGVPSANNYDLCTAIARDEWGFDGLIMTDWGGGISHPALSIWAGNDMLQPGGQDAVDTLEQSLGLEIQNPGLRDFSATLTRPLLEQSALRILRFVLGSETFRRRAREG